MLNGRPSPDGRTAHLWLLTNGWSASLLRGPATRLYDIAIIESALAERPDKSRIHNRPHRNLERPLTSSASVPGENLQAALNPAGERKVERFGWTFAPGDKVMQIENDYDKEVYNGDIDYIDDVDPEAGELVASFDGRSVTYGFGELEHAGSRLCRHHPQGPRISRRDHPRVGSHLGWV